MEHFDQSTTEKWLKEEGLEEKEIKIMWSYFGGSPWDIRQVLVMFKRGDGDLGDLCEDFYKKHEGQLYEFRNYLDEELISTFDQVNQEIVEKWFYCRNDQENKTKINKLVKKCVEQDIWFYRVETRKITANSEVFRRGMGNL